MSVYRQKPSWYAPQIPILAGDSGSAALLENTTGVSLLDPPRSITFHNHIVNLVSWSLGLSRHLRFKASALDACWLYISALLQPFHCNTHPSHFYRTRFISKPINICDS